MRDWHGAGQVSRPAPPLWAARRDPGRSGATAAIATTDLAQAIEIYRGPMPKRGPTGLMHRDYHPGNVLWSAGRVAGIVDWANASIGCGEADAGHCRMVPALSNGQEWADRFLAAYHALCGGRAIDYDPYWDIAPSLRTCRADLAAIAGDHSSAALSSRP